MIAKPPPGSDRWPAVYPIYINKFRTRQQGRRVRKADAVENPAFWEIRDVLKDAGFQLWIENKVHPREPDRFMPLGPPPMGNPHRGQIKFRLKDDTGRPCVEKFKNKMEVYTYLGQMIPKLKQRIEGTKEMEKQIRLHEEMEKTEAASGKNANTKKSANKGKSKKPQKAKKGKR